MLGFTLAEVLITLVIIGVIAAITVPSLITKYQKEQTVVKLKKAYSIISQSVIRSELDNGKLDTWWDKSDKNTIVFFDLFIKPYFSISRICNNYQICGYTISEPFKKPNGETGSLSMSADSVSRCFFYLTDGTFVFFRIYDSGKMIIIDLNGPKKPNKLGRDVFVLTYDENNSTVKPHGYASGEITINSNCSKNSTGEYCAAKIMKSGWRISDDYPW